MLSLRLWFNVGGFGLERGLCQSGGHLEDVTISSHVVAHTRSNRGSSFRGDADVHIIGQQGLVIGNVPGVRLLIRRNFGDVKGRSLGSALEETDVDVGGTLVHVLREVPGDDTRSIDGAFLVIVRGEHLEGVHSLRDVVDDGEGRGLSALLDLGAGLDSPDDDVVAGGSAETGGHLPVVFTFLRGHTEGNRERVGQNFGKIIDQLDVDKAGSSVSPFDFNVVAGVIGAVLGRQDDGVLEGGGIAARAAHGDEKD